MSTEKESLEIKKAMAFDLFLTLDSTPEKTQYTPEEIKELIKAYVIGLTQS